MPRAHRYFLPGHIWHITHRCHKQVFLLKFVKYRQCWLHGSFEAMDQTRAVRKCALASALLVAGYCGW